MPAVPFRCLQVLNLNSMADGIDFFGTSKCTNNDILNDGEFKEPKLNDGSLELVATKNVHQMNFMRVNVGRSLRIAQAETIEFRHKEPLPLEVDGEAWINPPGKVKVELCGKRSVIRGPKVTKSVRRG